MRLDRFTLADGHLSGVFEDLHASFAHQLAIDRPELAGEGGPGGHAQHGCLAIHGPTGADHRVSGPYQRRSVDRCARYDDAVDIGEAHGLFSGARQQHDLGIALEQSFQHVVEDGVLDASVVEAHGGRRPQHHDGAGGIEAEFVEHARVGHEIGQCDLFLEPRIGPIAPLIETQRRE